MEFIARTATHPNPRIDEKTARQELESHPHFKPGTVIVKMEQRNGHWVAELHEPKVAAPPPFGEDGPPSDDAPAPSDPSKDDEPDEPADDDEPKDDEPKDEKEDKGKEPDLKAVMDLVTQIAQAVGVPVHGGPDGPPPGMEGPDGPPGLDGPPPGPEGGIPPHDETSSVPGSPDTKQIIHRKAPPGATPVGSPAFASTKQASPKVASFEVDEPWDGTIREAKESIEAMYGPYGYKVKKIVESTNEQGQRTIKAKVSVR